jgi:hypothetical protein
MKAFIGIAVLLGIAAIVFFSLRREHSEPGGTSYPTVQESELKGVVRTNLDAPAPTTAQLDRKRSFTAKVAAMGLPTLDSLPVVEDDAAIRPRTPEEIVQRALCVAICAVKGETKDAAFAKTLIDRYGVTDLLTRGEKSFLDEASSSDQENADHAWQYERVHVLLWALGYAPGLAEPDVPCDAKAVVGMIKGKTQQALIAGARPRPVGDILDMADYYYRLHWSAIELRIHGQKSEKANEEIIMERHYALNWLVRYMNQEWDEVTTDT